MNSLTLYLSENSLFYLYSLKIFSLGIEFQFGSIFFQHFEGIIQWSLGFHCHFIAAPFPAILNKSLLLQSSPTPLLPRFPPSLWLLQHLQVGPASLLFLYQPISIFRPFQLLQNHAPNREGTVTKV